MRLLSTVGAAQTGALIGSTFTMHDTRRAPSRIVQFELVSGTATFLVEGRMGDDHSWVTLDTDTADAVAVVAAYPQVRCRLSAATAAVCFCDIDGDGREL